MTEAELARFVADINRNRGGAVRAVFECVATDTDTPHAALDRFARGCGPTPLGEAWRDISRPDAHALMVALLARDLAYDSEEMPITQATDLADRFFDVFSNAARFFTNTSSYGWNRLTASTFDAGVFGIDTRWIGALVVQDED